MRKTGVFATPEEVETLKTMMSMPYLSPQGIAPKSPLIQCHEYALAHGLPEIPGYYGCTQKGEFVEV